MSTKSNNRYSKGSRPDPGSSQNAPASKPPIKRKQVITTEEAYNYALRAAYLAYLLQPRQKKRERLPGQPAVRTASGASAMALLQDFTGRTDQKNNKFPSGFMDALQKRVTGVLYGKEKLPEFNVDPLVKRTFGAFLNEFINPVKRKSLERDRKMEELFGIFYASSVKELQKGKTPDDESWKLLSDRHLALFIRLIRSIMDENEWSRDRRELSSRLQTFEQKLLRHDLDLSVASSQNGGSLGQMIEVEVPLSYQVKDMPMVLLVSKIFNVAYGAIQDEINRHKNEWTLEAALKDLKLYQQCIVQRTKVTINIDDFDTEDAYDAWKKNEVHEISPLLFSIIQINPSLAKSTTASTIPQLQNLAETNDASFAEISKRLAENDDMNSIGSHPSFDVSALSLEDEHVDQEAPFTFIPPNPRLFYRTLVREVILDEISERRNRDAAEASDDPPLLSKKSIELLNELASRWRVPSFSRPILLLDAIKELYANRDIGLETIDKAFTYAKQVPKDKKKLNRQSVETHEIGSDWTKWTLKDLTMYQQCLSAIHDNLLRDLFQVMQNAYAPREPNFRPIMYILSEHVYEDDLFPKSSDNLDEFGNQLMAALKERAIEVYDALEKKDFSKPADRLEFFDVIQHGKKVMTICKKTQKRFQETPFVLGANPLLILAQTIFPIFAKTAVAYINQILDNTTQEIAIQDGFDVYREFLLLRQFHKKLLPSEKFDFRVEDSLQEFVYRYLQATEDRIPGIVENSVNGDEFQMLNPPGSAYHEERHSMSAVDVLKLFLESKTQVMDLRWSDSYQNAKFMTKLSRAMTGGVAKYCELLEQKFSKEMDRMTPEQEAAMNQTQQEKLMQFAKTAFAAKNKMEPFNFYPESLVKLNDIEYTMTNLDKIEQEVQSARCAEIIRRYEQQQSIKSGQLYRKASKIENYVFTVKIVEAEDLKACDINGLSDPYIVLVNEFQKRLHKTRIIYRNLNPRWDESLEIPATGALNIVATVWDWDALGDHDCVGRASLKLDPGVFKDYMPREYWLDLDTQGRILLRVSMEGERDDIEFYFGKAFRTLKRTEKDMTRQITDKVCQSTRYRAHANPIVIYIH
jgi:hypothetical protein